MQNNLKPNRPVRVGTEMVMTDDDGKIPEKKAATRKARKASSSKKRKA